MLTIADEIDRDRKNDMEALRYYLIGQVEEAVERLRYSTWTTVPRETEWRDAIPAEEFLSELDRIFGEH